ncbi:MAG: hypothetical protein HGA38_00585 [Candidatus Moranbacteria bacterium]|nr:hypothetical protein [Candidatus Moranbacteria bacterium]NTW46179.1 hypothetical protein [Candidatus Moranbacteria bacterium]
MKFDFERIYGENGQEKDPLKRSVHDAVLDETRRNEKAREEGRRLGEEAAPGIAKSILESVSSLSPETRKAYEDLTANGAQRDRVETFIDRTPTHELLKKIEAGEIPLPKNIARGSGQKHD